jgi:hypothetical protein
MVAPTEGKVMVVPSLPERVREFVTENVLEFVSVNVPVLVENVIPLTEVGVMAPAIMVSAGVAPPLEEPEKPFAVAIETAVTVPPAGTDHVPSPRKYVVEEGVPVAVSDATV